MARGRKRGCPVTIKNWVIEIFDVSADEWVRIYGLTSMNRTVSGDTGDGSSDIDTWEEPYITKRSGDLTLEGEYMEDEVTGERDRGQDLLNWYATSAGCENDASLRMTDPYGHIMVGDFVVTSAKDDWDNEEATCSWDLEQVGECEFPPYVHVTGLTLEDPAKPGQALTELQMQVGDPARLVRVKFQPANASNQRFRVYNSRQAFARITDVTDAVVTVVPVSEGETVMKFSSVNQAKVASLKVRVTA